MNEHLIVETKEKFLKVTCSEGHFLTDWDKENILEYHSARIMYCPLNADLSSYYCVTAEENAEYEEKQRIAIEEENNKE